MRDWVLPLAASAVVVVLQILLAPVLTVFSVVPSFIVPFVFVLSLMRRPDTTYVYAFVLGLIADLLSQTPVGLSSLLLLASSFALSRAFEVLDATTPAMPLLSVVSVSAVFELVFMIVLLITGYQASFIELLLYRVLPRLLFDAAIGALLYLIMRGLPFMQPSSDAWSVSDGGRFR